MKQEQRVYGCGCKKDVTATTPAATTTTTTTTTTAATPTVKPTGN